jgi:hypothetical protein
MNDRSKRVVDAAYKVADDLGLSVPHQHKSSPEIGDKNNGQQQQPAIGGTHMHNQQQQQQQTQAPQVPPGAVPLSPELIAQLQNQMGATAGQPQIIVLQQPGSSAPTPEEQKLAAELRLLEARAKESDSRAYELQQRPVQEKYAVDAIGAIMTQNNEKDTWGDALYTFAKVGAATIAICLIGGVFYAIASAFSGGSGAQHNAIDAG